MQSRLSRKPRELSTGGPFFDEALRRVDRLYAQEIAGQSQWSVTLLGDSSGWYDGNLDGPKQGMDGTLPVDGGVGTP